MTDTTTPAPDTTTPPTLTFAQLTAFEDAHGDEWVERFGAQIDWTDDDVRAALDAISEHAAVFDVYGLCYVVTPGGVLLGVYIEHPVIVGDTLRVEKHVSERTLAGDDPQATGAQILAQIVASVREVHADVTAAVTAMGGTIKR